MATAPNKQLQLATDFIRYTDKNLFLTGKAGTGKTTFLKNLKTRTFKRMVVVAPTGVAAINAGGVTIHSFFQLPFGPQLPGNDRQNPADASSKAARYQRFNREKINIIKSLDLLVIDEISMVRADLLDAIDQVLRRYRNRLKPFGGVQLLMIGDLQQLAPIVRDEDWELLRQHYDSVFFFSSRALQQTDYVGIELQHIYRQRDAVFIKLLNKVRENNLDTEAVELLNQRFKPKFEPADDEGYITLTTHNYQARDINERKLNAIKAKSHQFVATVTGDFPENTYPTDETLTLKEGAQVMFIKNDPSPVKEFYNGKIGKLIRIEEDGLVVQCPGEEWPITVVPLEWQNCRYALDDQSQEITETIVGTFKQYPLRLAWAVTIHKSQGLTFEKAIIDAQAAFAHGQVYVALSRCVSYEGMVLTSRINRHAIKNDGSVSQFIRNVSENQPDENKLEAARLEYERSLLMELYDFKPLLWHVKALLKTIYEHKKVLGDSILNHFKAIESRLRTDFIDVAEKFMRQLNELLAENPHIEKNDLLQQRIKKASDYFAPRFSSLVFADTPAFETENKVIRKAYQTAYDRLMADAQVKKSCLESCRSGFVLSSYLETRAKAAIEKQEVKRKAKPKEQATRQGSDSLYRRLREWRDELAEEMQVEPYRVLNVKALKAIADTLPGNERQLLAIKGVGPKKLEQFGDELLEMLQGYATEEGVDLQEDQPEQPAARPKPKTDSKQESLKLFKTGLSIAQVAEARGLAITTIEGHLAYCVKRGELDINRLMDKDKIALITEYFIEVEDPRLGPAKDVLGEEVSYAELRFVLNHLIHTGAIEDL